MRLAMVSPDFYRTVLRNPPVIAWRYFAGLIGLLALICTIKFTIVVSMVHVPQLLESMHASLVETYPDDLILTVDTGGISVNQPLPYAIDLPESWEEEVSETEWPAEYNPTNLVVFDQAGSVPDIETFWGHQALMVVTETSLYYYDHRRDQLIAQSLGDMLVDIEEPFIVTHETVRDIPVERASSHWALQPAFYVPLAAVIGFFAAYALLYVIILIQLILSAFVLFLIVEITMHDRRLSYGDVLRIGMYTVTTVLLLDFVAGIGGPGLPGYIKFFIFLLWSLIVCRSLPHQRSVAAAKAPAKKRVAAAKKRVVKKGSR